MYAINSYAKQLNKMQKSGRSNIGQIISFGKDIPFSPESEFKELSMKSLHAMKEIHSKMMDLKDQLVL